MIVALSEVLGMGGLRVGSLEHGQALAQHGPRLRIRPQERLRACYPGRRGPLWLQAFTTERADRREKAVEQDCSVHQQAPELETAKKIALDGIRRERSKSAKGTGLQPEQLVHEGDAPEVHTYPAWDEDRCPAFHLPTAVALGHCAFEAYNAPSSIHGLKEVDLHGTETVYMDRAFMEEVVTGVLALHVHSAAMLPSDGQDGKCKPSVAIRIGPSAGVTLEADGSQGHAEWGETLYLYVRDVESQQLEITVTEGSKNGSQDGEEALIGNARLGNLGAVFDGEVHELDVHLEGPGDTPPLMHLSVQYLDHGKEYDAITELPKLALLQMRDDDGWGHVEEPVDWLDPAFEEASASDTCQDGGGRADEQGEAAGESMASPDQGDSLGEAGTNLGSEHGLLHASGEGLRTIDPEDLAVALASGDQIASGESPDREDFQVWRDLWDDVARRDLATQLTPIAFLVNKGADTEAWVYRNKEKREAVFAFRGTSSPQDMLTDSAFTLAAYCPGDRPPSRSPDEVAAEIADEEVADGPMKGIFSAIDSLERLPGLDTLTSPATAWVRGLRGWAKSQLYSFEHKEKWVHKGFLEAYSSVRGRVVSLAHEIQDDGSHQPWKIYVTGHSLGGALAVLCAYELKATHWKGVPSPEVIVYTFGQPRVGNVAFSEDYDELVPHTWRVKNVNDIVTRVPAVLGYSHVGCEATVCPDGGIMLASGSRDDLQDSVAVEDIVSRITDGMKIDEEKAKEKLGGIVEKEMGLWRSLFTGAAILEHLESKYHEVLKLCIEAGGQRCEPVIKTIDSVPTRDHVERLLRRADSSKDLLPSPQHPCDATPCLKDDTVEVLARSHSVKVRERAANAG